MVFMLESDSDIKRLRIRINKSRTRYFILSPSFLKKNDELYSTTHDMSCNVKPEKKTSLSFFQNWTNSFFSLPEAHTSSGSRWGRPSHRHFRLGQLRSVLHGVGTVLREPGEGVPHQLEGSCGCLWGQPVRWLRDEQETRKLLYSILIPRALQPN